MVTAHPQQPDQVRAEAATTGGASGARRAVRRAGALAAAAAVVTLALPAAAAAQVSFHPAANLPTGDLPRSVAVGDFNGDSDPDLAVANQLSDNVSVLLGGAEGSFDGPTNFAGEGPRSVAVGDFNGDADPDLAVVIFGYVSVLLGGAGGSFEGPTNFDGVPVTFPYSVAVGDFNGDSDPDLATVGLGSGHADVSVWLGGTDGSFGAPTEVAAGTDCCGVEQFRSVAVGDFNGDSDPDLAVANFDDDTVMVLLGGPDGSFAAPTNLPTFGDGPSSVAVGDFNGDSDPDLAVANQLSDNVSVLRGEPGGDFAEPITFAAGDEPISLAVGDFDDNSDPDLAVANRLSDNISVLLGGAGADFAEAKNFPTGDGPASVAVGDFNLDARPDLAVANSGSDDVSVLLNTSNLRPTPADDTYEVNEDTRLTVDAPGVLGNDTDPDSDALTAAGVVSAPGNGAVTLDVDGSFSYRPDPDFSGSDSFIYLASDGHHTAPATVTIEVRAFDPPTPAGDAYAMDEDTRLSVPAPGVLGNDTDPNGDTLTAALATVPGNGAVTLDPDGSFSYRPDPDFNGSDSFSYLASDGHHSATATVTIEVRAVDEPPPAGARPPAAPAPPPPAGAAPPPPADTAPAAPPAAPSEQAISQLRLGSRCLRPSRSGRVRIAMKLRMARPRPVQVRIDRAVGPKTGRSCPKQNRFTGRFRRIATLRRLATRPAAAGRRRLTLRPRLSPGLYRITVRAQLDHNRLSRPTRRYLRVLG